MCTRLKVAKAYITPGMTIQYRILSGIKSGKFGIAGGSYPNARREGLGTTWRHYYMTNRAILEIDSFIEKGTTFGKKDKPTKLACIYDLTGDLAIITTDSIPEVAKVHHRMPCIIEDEYAWLNDGVLKLADSDITTVI